MHQKNYQTYLELKQNNPRLYAVDLAQKMGISEAELAMIRIGFDTQYLSISAEDLLNELSHCGIFKAITRNPYAVSEQFGTYTNINFSGHAGLILNPRGIDLRLFFSQWKYIFAFNEPFTTKAGLNQIRKSIQIFNSAGVAVHKIYTTEHTDMDLFEAIVNAHSQKHIKALSIEKNESIATNQETPKTIDKQAFEQKWRSLQDVHEFYGLLKQYNLTRQDAFKSVSKDLAYQVVPAELETLLTQIQKEQNEVMFFVSNIGCVQIFTGKLEKVVLMHGWLNIFNESFTLHLQHLKINEAWITRKPTKDGIVTSLELYSDDGQQILQMYGQRTEGQAEQIQWRNQLSTLTPINYTEESY